jgi:hypothetical protein
VPSFIQRSFGSGTGHGNFEVVTSSTTAGQNCDRATDAPWWANGGGRYAPFVLSRYTSGTVGRTTVYYLLSTWNPYQVVFMRMTLTG